MTLLIGANLPDIDALAYFGGPYADLAVRRGWTHGILALAVLPLVLTGAMLLAGRLARRLNGSVLPSGTSPRELLLLATVSIVSHPILDTLNTYGVRWLMPFDGRWFYGDAVFIVDPWLWLALGLGVFLSRRRWSAGRGYGAEPSRPARMALLFTAVYAAAMALSGVAARRIAARELAAGGGGPVDRLMLSPLPVSPLRRTVVAGQGDRYVVGSFRWTTTPRVDPASLRSFPRERPEHPAVRAAAATVSGRRFLGWARFPTWRVETLAGGSFVVHIVDLRYADRPGVTFGSISVPVTLPAEAAAALPPAPGTGEQPPR